MRITATLKKSDMIAFQQANKFIAKQAGVSVKKILPYQVGGVMNKAANLTRSWRNHKPKLEKDFRLKAARNIGLAGKKYKARTGGDAYTTAKVAINLGVKKGDYGRVYWVGRRNGKLFKPVAMQPTFAPSFPTKWGNKIVNEVQQKVADYRAEEAKYMRGFDAKQYFSKRSWLDIVEDIVSQTGINQSLIRPKMSFINKVKQSTTAEGHVRVNGKAKSFGNPGDAGFFIVIENWFPGRVKNKMRQKLITAVRSRARTIRKDFDRGVFNDLKAKSRRYPFLKVA